MRRLLVFIASISLLLTSMAFAQDSLLDEIQQRGELICGVNGRLPGFSTVTETGEVVGMDADLCRAIAAAVLGDADAVEFVLLDAQERFTALQTGEIDILIRNTTWTSSRDSELGLTFAPTTFYDCIGFMVPKNSGIDELQDFEGQSICVQSGTTTELNLADVFEALEIQYEPVVFENLDQLLAAYQDGACAGWTTDSSGLVGSTVRLQNPEAHKILPARISKEPLGPSVLEGDPEWADAVRWIIYGLFNAEEYGITSENVMTIVEDAERPAVRRMLGVEGNAVTQLGLPADAIVQAIDQVGNYGEIFANNLGPDTPFALDRGLNAQYYEGGLIYGKPFR